MLITNACVDTDHHLAPGRSYIPCIRGGVQGLFVAADTPNSADILLRRQRKTNIDGMDALNMSSSPLIFGGLG